MKQRQGFILLVQFLIHTVDKNAERNPKYQGENQNRPNDVICQKLPKSVDAQLVNEIPKSLNYVLYSFLTFAL